MSRPHLFLPLAALVCVLAITVSTRGDFPKPSPFPVSWELTATFAKPQRIVVKSPGDDTPHAYWYVAYHVVNNSDRDRVPFYPTFDLSTQDGQVIRDDTSISPAVFDAIKIHEHVKFLLNSDQVGGDLRGGDDQSRDGVAIFPEPDIHMGTFDIFITGFWGESTTVKVADKDVILHKTLQKTYHLTVDESNPADGALNELDSQYIMR